MKNEHFRTYRKWTF